MARPRNPRIPGLAPLLADRNMAEIARRLDVSQSAILLMRDGKRGASPRVRQSIAQYFNVTEDQLLDSQIAAAR